MRKRIKNFNLAAILTIMFCFNVFIFQRYSFSSPKQSNQIIELQKPSCNQPNLDIDNPIFGKFDKNVGQQECNKEDDWLSIDNGFVKFSPEIIKEYGKIYCNLSYVERVTDFINKFSELVSITSDDKDPHKLKDDFFTVRCSSKNYSNTWNNLMAGIHRKEDAVHQAKTSELPKNAMGLNVLMFGFDSVSRIQYMRKLPKTYNYLTQVLNATVLKGYNIVGDGTPQALIPILTGATELELPETRKRMENANFVNVYPFVWNNFSASGYITVYGEDGPSAGTFMYRLKGFDQAPTDHYMRPFYLNVDKIYRQHSKYCLGNIPRHKVMLNYFRQFFDVYNDVLKFGFLFHSELSHGDYNLINLADSDTEIFLKDLHEDGILNNTIVIFMSDHGARYGQYRRYFQLKLEERLPFFSIVVPPWFEKKYPVYAHNLKLNSDRLVTPFDIYPTFLTLLDSTIPETEQVSNRSISLFKKIPLQRTCADANIEPHWCACLSWIKLSPSEPFSQKLGTAVVNFINNYTSSQRAVCATLVLDRITRLEKLAPTENLLKFKKSHDIDGRTADFSDTMVLSETIYQVQLYVLPSSGIYEVTLNYYQKENTFMVKEQDISRIDAYGNQEHCIHYTYPELRKYCYCIIQKP